MAGIHSAFREPYFYLGVGVISLCIGVVSTLTGVTWARFGRVVYRSKQPRAFWEDVIACYFIGSCFVGYFFYLIN